VNSTVESPATEKTVTVMAQPALDEDEENLAPHPKPAKDGGKQK